MKAKSQNLLGDLLKNPIHRTVKTKLFPEIWYILDQWLGPMKQKQVLEMGYGLGLISPALAQKGWQVTQIDPSEIAVSALEKEYAKSHLDIEVTQATFDTLPFADESFSAVVAVNTLELSSSRTRTLEEIHRVLHPGGKAIIVSFAKFSPWGMASVLGTVRRGYGHWPPQFFNAETLVTSIKASGLMLHDILDRGGFLPIGTPIPIEVKSVMVALAERRRG